MWNTVLQLEQCNSEKDALVDHVLVFIYTLSWFSITGVLYKCQRSISQLVVDKETWPFAMQSMNLQGCCRRGNRRKSCSVQSTLGFSVVLRSKYRKLPISHFSPRRWTSRKWSSADIYTIRMVSKCEITLVPLFHKNGHLHTRHEELSMCMCACLCVCVCKTAYSCFYWTNHSCH